MTDVIYYVNQFFGGIGGEDKADTPLVIHEKKLGPAIAFQNQWGEDCNIIRTIVCGDNYFNENQDYVIQKIVDCVNNLKPDLFVAGPAFNAGRYGFACATICREVQQHCNILTLTGMYSENPGVKMGDRSTYIVSTSNSASGMRNAMPRMVSLSKKLANSESILSADVEGYIPRGFRRTELAPEIGAVRAVQMLHKKLKGEAYITEVKLESYERVPAAPAIKDLAKATIAIVTEAGIVPIGNPDRIKHASAENWAQYSLENVDDLVEGEYEGVHGGFDASYCNNDPDRVLPLDALRYFESTGYIGKLFETYFVTVGNGTPIERCKKFGAEIAKKLMEAKVDGVLLPSS